MLLHQAGQGRAIGGPVVRAQVVGPDAVDLQGAHHPVGHPPLDLVEQAHVRRVKRIVQVENPGGDCEKGILWHAAGLSAARAPGKG